MTTDLHYPITFTVGGGIETATDNMTKTVAIDLGLPSGTLWGDRNLGADAPENFGDYYRFGETVPFTAESLPFEYKDLGGDFEIGGTEHDAATVRLGPDWQMPTEEQINELHFCCTGQWETVNGIQGLRVTGPNGNSIFLPLAGGLNRSGKISGVGELGCVWSSSFLGSKTGALLFFMSRYWNSDNCDRAYGYPVRPVKNY